MDKFIGRIFSSRYEIIEKIGSGGMANVYKAHCKLLDRYVAIKILREEFKNEKEFVDRFKREGRAVSLLSHQNIVAVYDVGVEDNLPFLVMELIEGMTLKEYIIKKKTLTTKECIYIAEQILAALQHAHSKNIIHRDIKPQNILLLKDGTLKVTDFGIAKFALSETRTMTGGAIGSVHYISPEQAKGGMIDGKADIYSLGVIMYEMLTGVLPFDDENAVTVAVMHIQGKFQLPSALLKDLPKGLEQITLRAMCRNLNLRYQNAGEMLNDLKKFKEDPDIVFNYKFEYAGEQGTVKLPRIKSTEYEYQYEEEEKPNKTATLVKIIAIIMCILLIFSLGRTIYNGMVDILNGMSQEEVDENKVDVPNFVGMDLDVARESQDENVLRLVADVYKNSDTFAEGEIIYQYPEQGTIVEKGQIVKLTVSLGKGDNLLPDFAASEYRSAVIKIKELGMESKVTEKFSNSVPIGYVISTIPDKNTEIKPGQTVELFVSKGREIISKVVPNVVDLPVDEAKKRLEESGFVVNVMSLVQENKAAGIVLSQSVPGDTEAEEKSEITIVISEGPPEKVETSYNLYVGLPTTPDKFLIRVYVNDELQYQQYHNASERNIYVQIKGKNTAKVLIYANDNLIKDQTIIFN